MALYPSRDYDLSKPIGIFPCIHSDKLGWDQLPPIDFEGENYSICHTIRAGKRYLRAATSERCDVVIIGAGISGLTCAHKLRNRLTLRIIEKEGRSGGASKRGEWKGIYYSYGAADTGPSYEVEIEGRRMDFLKPLFDELAVPWQKVVDPTFALKIGGKLVVDPLHAQSSDQELGEVRKSFENAEFRIGKIYREYGSPVIPMESNNHKTLELDRKSLNEVLEGVGRPFRTYLEVFSMATFGASSSEVSALKGLYYLGRELGDRYTCPGGNALFAEALADKLKDRVELNSTVVSVEQNKDSCHVTYLTGGSEVRTVECKAVVWACEKHYAPYIIKGLPKDQEESFRKIRYSSFIVANVLAKAPFYESAFATYFDNSIFADMVIADWVTRRPGEQRTEGPSVYTLYCPIGTRQRHIALKKPVQIWRREIMESLQKQFGKVKDKISDIRFYRYGHHYVVSYPGFISGERDLVKRPFDRVFFAKDDTQGVPALESAVWSGLDSARKIMEMLQ